MALTRKEKIVLCEFMNWQYLFNGKESFPSFGLPITGIYIEKKMKQNGLSSEIDTVDLGDGWWTYSATITGQKTEALTPFVHYVGGKHTVNPTLVLIECLAKFLLKYGDGSRFI